MPLSDEDWLQFYTGSILNAEAAFDKPNYLTLNDRGKKLMILEIIQRIVKLCIDKYSWDNKPFKTAYNGLLAEL